MAVPLEKFVKQLEDSGILTGDTLKDFLPPRSEPKSAEELALELVRKKKLTKFQAEEVAKGKGKALTLGNYVLMEKIGAGGMGQVFKAEHRRMHRSVAIKVLPPNMMKDAAAIARFEREVTAAAKLRHPNIVAADDADCANGVHFLVMELVEGSDLSVLVKKNGPFPIAQAVHYILQAAKGLEFAHNEGVVHRDIKPANLLLDKKGVVKILDMGLARLSGDVDAPTQAELTSTGTVMGTVDYMAPEQALNTKAADHRADIYALGCSLYYLLAGKATYDGDTLMAKLLAHRDQSIPALRATCPEVSEQLETVFKKMVAKKVEDRYQTMTEVIADLERCRSVQPVTQTFQQPDSTTLEKTATLTFSDKTSAEATILSTPSIKAALTKTANNKKLVLIGAVVLGVAMLAVIIVSLKTKDGTLIVEVDQPDAVVQVLDAEGEVEISQKSDKGKVSISVDSGKHRLKVEKDGFAVFGQDVEMQSGGKTPIKAKLVPLEDKPAMVGAKPAMAVEGTKKPLFFQTPGFDPWAKDVAAMPADKQVEAVANKLVELNPGFDGKLLGAYLRGEPVVNEGKVIEVEFRSDTITDLSPLRAFAYLRVLGCLGSDKGANKLVDIAPLRGMPLTKLTLTNTRVSDLSPLKGMSLAYLYIGTTQVTNLTPLEGMPLRVLSCINCPVSDIAVLSSCKWMEQIDARNTDVTAAGVTALQIALPNCKIKLDDPVKTEVSAKSITNINDPAFQQWMKDVQAMPAEMQVEAVSKKLIELNPGFDGKLTGFETASGKGSPKIENGVVTGIGLSTLTVLDLSPLRVFVGLNDLDCNGGALTELSPLKGMPLTKLAIHFTQVSDLSPLRALELKYLDCYGTQVSDLSPLKGTPLKHLDVRGTRVTELSALKEMPLKFLALDFEPDRDTEILRSIKALETINNKPAAEFWKEVEEKKEEKNP
jgi:serine/threonine-protein kinase